MLPGISEKLLHEAIRMKLHLIQDFVKSLMATDLLCTLRCIIRAAPSCYLILVPKPDARRDPPEDSWLFYIWTSLATRV